jgi:transposase
MVDRPVGRDSLDLQQDRVIDMPWNETDRAKCAVIRECYASDLSDAEFALIEPLLPRATPRGRKPTDRASSCRQSVKTTEAGGPGGYDASQKVKGRPHHIAVDTFGLPIKCTVTTVDGQDRDALPAVRSAVSTRALWVKLAFVDGGYTGDETPRAAFAARLAATAMGDTGADTD